MMDRYCPLRHRSSVFIFHTRVKKIPEKIIVFSYDAGTGTLLSIVYDEYRLPETGCPYGGSMTRKFKKLFARSTSQEALMRRSFR